jgi:hypothetical protein
MTAFRAASIVDRGQRSHRTADRLDLTAVRDTVLRCNRSKIEESRKTVNSCRYLGIFIPSARSAADITVARWLVLQ